MFSKINRVPVWETIQLIHYNCIGKVKFGNGQDLKVIEKGQKYDDDAGNSE